jgi:hypothetical protein
LVEAQNKVEVCNGEEGAPGAEGEPWSPNSALPTGATETGTYTFNATAANAEFYVPISFPIQLKNPLEISHVHFGTQFEAPFNTICTGSLIKPTAPSGDLCIYKGETANATYVQTYEITLAEEGASRSGAVMIFNVSGAGFGIGSWAVTGE